MHRFRVIVMVISIYYEKNIQGSFNIGSLVLCLSKIDWFPKCNKYDEDLSKVCQFGCEMVPCWY